jgi:broad specificity phosphatase PhoE
MRLILVRHGQTTCNVREIWHGWDECELTDTGRQQAEAAANRLASEKIDAIVSSDSPRALQTAGIIAARHGLVPEPEPGLRERMAGEFEGLGLADVIARHPTVWKERAADYWGWRPPGGESFQEVLERAGGVIDRLRREYPRGIVVVVTHMGVTRALITRLAGISLADTYGLEFPSTGVSIFSLDEGKKPVVEALNDVAHIG